jgi:hypothetical protein
MQRSTAEPTDTPDVTASESYTGIGLVLVAFVIASNVCSAIASLAVLP